jgi:hypothetical protein
MARHTLAYLVMSFFIISSAFSAGNDLGLVSENPVHPFQFVRIEEICHKFAVVDFDSYFKNWIVKHLENSHSNLSPTFLEDLDKELGDHKKIIEKYLEDLLKSHLTVPDYSNAFLEIEVEDLLKKISGVMKSDYIPKYQSLNFDNISDRIGDFKKTVEETPLKPHFIGKVADLFRPIYNKIQNEDPNYGKYASIMPILVENIKDQLKKIIDIYLDNPNSSNYDALTPEDKILLVSFYNNFKFLLDLGEIRSQIIQRTVGEEPENTSTFFLPELYSSIKDIADEYKPIFERDNFILNYKDDPTLDEMRTAALKVHFGPHFPAIFESDFNDLELGVTKDQRKSGPENQAKRSKAKLELMLYELYTMLRKPDEIGYNFPTENKDILEKIFDFIVTTDIFNTDKPARLGSDNGDRPSSDSLNLVDRPERKLISPEKFQTYFVPLLNLICEKLGQKDKCDLFEKKADLIDDKFKDFENILLFNDSKSDVYKLVPPTILKKLKDTATKKHFDDFKTNLDDIINKAKKHPKSYSSLPPSEIEDSLNKNAEKENDLPSDVPAMLNNKSKKQPSTKAGPQEEIDEEFETFADKFLPKEQDANPEKVEMLQTLLKTVGNSPNDNKQKFLKDALVNYIVKKAKSKDIDIENSPLVSETLKNLMTRLFIKINASGVDSIRNFMNYHLLTFNGNDIDSQNPLVREIALQKFYDLLIFAYLSGDNYVKILEKTKKTPKQVEEFELWTQKQEVLRENLRRKDMLKYINILTRKLYFDPANIKRVDSFNFFHSFLDFFAYFKNMKDANATYGDYNLVFLNFYNFLHRIRAEIAQEVLSPYTFVYKKLNDCLAYTSRYEQMHGHEELKNLCVFSHRKYAEILFFYKTYLIVNNKPGSFDLAPFPSADFNTHVRVFLNFLSQNPEFSNKFVALCNGSEESICKSWSIFEDILGQLSTFKTAGINFNAPIYKSIDHSTFAGQMSVVNGLEAVSLAYFKSNNKDYEKTIRNIQYSSNGNVVYVEDVELLGDYLGRTYRKLEFTPEELVISSVVQHVLADERIFLSFLTHNGNLFFDYIKLFLLYANSDDQYNTIAQVLVNNKFDLVKLAFINTPDHDSFLAEVIASVVTLSETKAFISDLANLVRSKLQNRYSLITGTCTSKTFNELIAHESDVENLDDLSEMLREIQDQMFDNVQAENEEFIALMPTIDQVEVVNTYHVVPVISGDLDQYERELEENDALITAGLSPNKLKLGRADSQELYNTNESVIAVSGIVIPMTDTVAQENNIKNLIDQAYTQKNIKHVNHEETIETVVELEVPKVVAGRKNRKGKLLL